MQTTDSELRGRLEQAIEFAQTAGRETLRYFRHEALQVERKSDDSPVTVADRQAEQLLRAEIERHFAQDAIVGEELGSQGGTSGYRWILDPIDGTKSFIHGVPLYGTLVGIERDGEGVAGVIFMPALNELIFAGQGQGAWYRVADQPAQPARVSSRPLREGLLVTSQVDSFARRGAMEAFFELQAQASVTRTWGDCYGYLLVATGRAELMIDPVLNVWDAAAVKPIVEEAGGRFTDWQGEPSIYSGDAIGCNAQVLSDVLTITRPFPRPG